jgi:threonine dehydrogenase-like Zn-dependent dehydrogenase
MLAEFYVDDPRFIVPIPEEHSEVAVLLEPLTIAEKGIFQTFEVQKRMAWEPKTALVLGIGPLGILCAMLLRDMEIETFAVGRGPLDPVRRTFLETMGVNYITTRETPLVEIPKKLGCQVDFVIEATGSSQVSFDAMQVIGINGALCLMGVSGGNKMLQVPADVINLEMVLGNKLILGSVNANRKYFEMGVRRFARFEKRWPGLLSRFVTKRVGMDGFMEGIAKDRSQLKVVIEVGD